MAEVVIEAGSFTNLIAPITRKFQAVSVPSSTWESWAAPPETVFWYAVRRLFAFGEYSVRRGSQPGSLSCIEKRWSAAFHEQLNA